MDDGRHSAIAEISAEQRGAAGAVDVVITENRDAFAPLDRGLSQTIAASMSRMTTGSGIRRRIVGSR